MFCLDLVIWEFSQTVVGHTVGGGGSYDQTDARKERVTSTLCHSAVELTLVKRRAYDPERTAPVRTWSLKRDP